MAITLPVTRDKIFMRWSSGTEKRCWPVLMEGHSGPMYETARTFRESLYDGRLLILVGKRKGFKRWAGRILVDQPGGGDDTHSDGWEDVYIGSAQDLHDAWAATDLEILTLTDDEYWDAVPIQDLVLSFDYDNLGTWVVADISLAQRTAG